MIALQKVRSRFGSIERYATPPHVSLRAQLLGEEGVHSSEPRYLQLPRGVPNS